MKSSIVDAIEKLLDSVGECDMDYLARTVRYRANILASSGIQIGDRVIVDQKPYGIKRGILVKKNRKNFVVRIGKSLYNVPPSIIKKDYY